MMKNIFDCCKQSLTPLSLPPIPPSTHPPTQQGFRSTSTSYPLHFAPHCSLFSRDRLTFQFIIFDSFFSRDRLTFQLKIFDANSQHFLFQNLFPCKIYYFLKYLKFNIFLKNWPPLKFIFNIIRNFNFKIRPFLAYLLKI